MTAVHLPETPPVIAPKISTKTSFSWSNLITGITRAEVVFTAIGVLLPQIVSFANDAALNHLNATEFSVLAGAVFTAAEAIKDGLTGTKS